MNKWRVWGAVLCWLGGRAFAGEGGADERRYHEAQWKAAHNSYAQPVGLLTQLQDYGFRSIEFDLHIHKRRLGQKETAPAGDFLVYHRAYDDYTNCRLLSECLAVVADFHRQKPDHEVITIFFDLAGLESPHHTKAELYARLEQALSREAILAPGDLLAACPGAETLQEAVTRPGCGWPRLGDLRGKFILVISDGREEIKASGYQVERDLLFLVAKGHDPKNLYSDPDLVFFNLAGPHPFLAQVKQAGFVSRSYWLNDRESYLKAKRRGANHLATDRIDPQRYPWTEVEETER